MFWSNMEAQDHTRDELANLVYQIQNKEKGSSYDKPRALREELYGGKYVVRQEPCDTEPVAEHPGFNLAA